MTRAEKRRRFWRFWKLFSGVVWDFWRESRLSRRAGPAEARRRLTAAHKRRAIQFREAALEMGGVLVKLGQFLGIRADIMPEAYIEELSTLQDQVPPVPYEEIAKVVEGEFGRPIEEVFPHFNKAPIAAASLAQAHEATLPDGTDVVVKVQRLRIDELADYDLGVFSYLVDGVAALTQWGKDTDLPSIAAEFVRVFGDELDFFREAYSAEKFAVAFAGYSNIHIPRVYWDYVTQRVVTLEKAQGIKPTDAKSLREHGIDPKEVADVLMDAYLKQILSDGFFHADPHPGNIFVAPGPIVTFIDFGMVDMIKRGTMAHLKDLIIAIAMRDVDEIVNVIAKMGFVRSGADVSPVRDAIAWLFSYYGNLTAKDIDIENLDKFQADIRRILYEKPIKLPSEFGFLGRAVAVVAGLINQISPNYDYVGAVKPYVAELTSSTSLRTKFFKDEAKTVGKALLALPTTSLRMLERLERGEIGIQSDFDKIARAVEYSHRVQSLSGYATLTGALSITAAVCLAARFLALGYVFFGLAGLFLLITVVAGGRRS